MLKNSIFSQLKSFGLTQKALNLRSYLACRNKVFQGVDSQTEDVIVMAHIETLSILLSVIHHPNSSYMIDNFPGLGVEEVASAIIAPVAAKKCLKKRVCLNTFF